MKRRIQNFEFENDIKKRKKSIYFERKLSKIVSFRNLLKISDIDEKIKKKLKSLYSDASKYIHMNNFEYSYNNKRLKAKNVIKRHNKLIDKLKNNYLD